MNEWKKDKAWEKRDMREKEDAGAGDIYLYTRLQVRSGWFPTN